MLQQLTVTNRYSFLDFSVASRRVEKTLAFSSADANSKSLPGFDFFPLLGLKSKKNAMSYILSPLVKYR